MGATKRLKGKVSVVVGATRGAGRGIACMLGEAGSTVYCTGRSVRGSPNLTGYFAGRPESIDETAEMVAARGGIGIPVRVDHLIEEQVQALVDRIRIEQGRLDVLVNDISEGDVHEFKPFWELSLERAFAMFRNAVHSHVITCRHAVPLMIQRKRSSPDLIVEVGDGDTLDYRAHLFYDLIKVTVSRLAYAMAEELHKHRVAAVAVTPGYMRTETMLEGFGVTEANWREGGKQDPNFLASETPFFVGRAVAALAADPDVMDESGGLYGSWTLSEEYGFSDIDGNRPNLGRHFERVYGDEPPMGPRQTAFHWTVSRGPKATVSIHKRRARSTRK
ncbi:MAG: SDR family NAD(P)-dependent oxidoreductase [Gemmatimonadetes bacterium]|nr:SDR family NAD(P)-dependent oxidoreductase [Gemmatimonadota bacterium]